MGIAIEMTKAFLDSKDLHYREISEGEVLSVEVGGLDNKGTLQIFIVFDDDNEAAALRVHDYVKVPENRLPAIFKVCNEMNAAYRWVKFYVDKEDNSITVEDDAIIQPESCGEEIFELLLRIADISNEAYPNFMKAIYS